MKKRDFDKLEGGIYEVIFCDDITTLAIIGNSVEKGNWIAPLNFNYPVTPNSTNYKLWIRRITYIKLLMSESAYRMFKFNRKNSGSWRNLGNKSGRS